MFDNVLLESFPTSKTETIEELAARAAESGEIAHAVAILATGYENGGDANLLDQAYTLLLSTDVSRRMLNKAAEALGGQQSRAILENSRTCRRFEFLDDLVPQFETFLASRARSTREPSSSLLLLAEKRLAEGASGAEVLAALPRSDKFQARADLIRARIQVSSGDGTSADALLKSILEKGEQETSAASMLADLSRITGNEAEAANFYQRSMIARFSAVSPNNVPAGQVQVVSTLLGSMDVFICSAGFVVVRKKPGLIGVTMAGSDPYTLMQSRRYRQLSEMRLLLERVIGVEKVISYFRTKFMLRKTCQPEQRAELNRESDSAPFRFAKTESDVGECGRGAGSVLHANRYSSPPSRKLRRAIYQVVLPVITMLRRFILYYWLKAEKIPGEQITKEASKIFEIANAMDTEQMK